MIIQTLYICYLIFVICIAAVLCDVWNPQLFYESLTGLLYNIIRTFSPGVRISCDQLELNVNLELKFINSARQIRLFPFVYLP